MKKVLKILALVLTLAMVFSLAACGNQDNATSGSNSESAGIAKDKLKIGVIHIGDPADGSGYSYARSGHRRHAEEPRPERRSDRPQAERL